MIILPESIRQLGVFEIKLNLHSELEANISLLVHPEDVEPAEFEASLSVEQTEADTTVENNAGNDLADSNETTSEDEKTPPKMRIIKT